MAKKSQKNKNQKNLATSQALVVYQKPAEKKKKKPKSKNKVDLTNMGLTMYKAALLDPFSINAQGARVPDMYASPTTTRHITKTFTIATNASGEADIVVLPSAYHHAVSPRGSLVNGAAWLTIDGNSVANALQYTDPNTLAASLTNYRIVGYGVKIFGIQSMTGTAGKVLVATSPISSNVNDKNATIGGFANNSTNSSATKANTLKTYGIPTSSGVVDVASLPSMPNSMETSLVRVTEVPMRVIPKLTSPEAFMFRQSMDNAIGFNINQQTSVTNVVTGDASWLRVAGFECVTIALTGCAASTNCLEVEVVYHLEGNPFQSTTGFAVIGNDTNASLVAPVSWMNIVQSVAKTPAFKTAVETAGNSFFPGLGTLANKFF